MNEALILAALGSGSEATIADLAARLDDNDLERKIGDGSIYIALQRMVERGYVTSRKTRVVSGDGRPRDIGVYQITGQGLTAVQRFDRDAQAVLRLRAAQATL